MKEVAKHLNNWASNARKELYGKPSSGSVEKSKRRHKLKVLKKYK